MSGEVFWGIRPKSADARAVTDCLVQTFREGAKAFGYESTDSHLLATKDYTIAFDSGPAADGITPETGCGLGTITGLSGHIPLLMLFLVSDRMSVLSPNHSILTFSDDKGGEVFWTGHFEDWTDQFDAFGWDTEVVRSDAVRLGLVVPIIDLAQIQTTEPDFFF